MTISGLSDQQPLTVHRAGILEILNHLPGIPFLFCFYLPEPSFFAEHAVAVVSPTEIAALYLSATAQDQAQYIVEDLQFPAI